MDLCVHAAENLLVDCEIDKEEIGAVIGVTFTPDLLMPNNACGAQARLKLSNKVLAFDINLACSGYVYGLYIAGLLANQLHKKILLLDGDVQSAFLSHEDKATEPVMGDAGSATIVDYDQNSSPWNFAFLTDGELRDVLCIPAGGSKHPIKENDLQFETLPDGSRRKPSDIHMDGFGVFKFVASQATGLLQEFLQEMKITGDEITAFIPHQANIYMVTQMGKRLKISQNKVWISGDIFGNPSSASIPLTLAHGGSTKSNKLKNVLLSGFGGGMSVSVALGEIKQNCCFKTLDYAEKFTLER